MNLKPLQTVQKLAVKIRAHAFLIIASAAVLIAYYFLFGSYFPNANAGLGADYKQQLPNLLAGYYWFQNNGLFSIPWFNPAQCGGVPFYADPGHGLYSLPQFLVLFFNPVLAIKITFFFFALAGYFGFYFLLRRKFHIDQAFAALGAVLFLFNGFYAGRMIIGHPFHAFMLLPYLAILLLPQPLSPTFFSRKNVFAAALAGAIMAYMFHSAMIHIIPPLILSTVIILLIHAYLYGRQKGVWLRFGAAMAMALGLASSKLVASLSLLAHFPRDYYSLPGFPKLFDALNIAGQSLFFRPPVEQVMKLITNWQWAIEQHELEFGVTLFPLIIISAAAVFGLTLLARKKIKIIPSKRAIGYLGAIVLLLFIPIALNLYHPAWNKILKSLPLIKDSSILLRWFAAYIPISVLTAMLLLNFHPMARKYAVWIAAAAIIFIISYQSTENRAYYKTQAYDGRIINQAYERSKSSGAVIPIKGVAIFDPEEAPDPARGRNDMMIVGLSQLTCYNAIFGYRLERFPFGDLHPGPAFEITNGHFNIKNPACYIFPKENNCRPGDHFQVSRREDAEKFLQYKPYPFKKSYLQKFADGTNVTFLLLLGGILIYPVGRLKKRRQPETSSDE